MLMISFVVALSGCAGGYVAEQPADVVYDRPVSPGVGYVWIDGDWFWSGGRYQWHAGHWDRPRAGRAWVRGSWHSSGRGYHWQRGHWH
jgi:WXXGXW repeat (2 copies)